MYKKTTDIQEKIELEAQRLEAEADYSDKVEDLAVATERSQKLLITATIDGTVIAPRINDLLGKYVESGEELLTIYDQNTLYVRANTPQEEAALGFKESIVLTEMRAVGNIADTIEGRLDPDVIPTIQQQLSTPGAGIAGGGTFQTNPQDQTGTQVDNGVAWYPVKPANISDVKDLVPGQRMYVHFKLENKPLIWQIKRKIQQLIQQNSGGKWS